MLHSGHFLYTFKVSRLCAGISCLQGKSNARLIWLALSLNTEFEFTPLEAVVFSQIGILKCPVSMSDVNLASCSHSAFSGFSWGLPFPQL